MKYYSIRYQRFFIFIENRFTPNGPWRIANHVDTLFVSFKVFVLCSLYRSTFHNV